MKKICYFILGCFGVFGFIGNVNAATPSATLSVSSSSIYNGSKVTATVTVKNTAAWNIKITSAGNTNGCSQSFADATSNGLDATKSFTVTCKANSLGTISFTLSGDISSSDGTNKNVSGSKSVRVVEKAPDSTVNTLKSLSVDGYELSPLFSEDTLEYSVSVASDVEKIKINAAKKDAASSVSGVGELDVLEGSNRFEIVVRAESGDERTYVINVLVEDLNPIEVKVDNEIYTILKTSRSIEIPSLYTESVINISDVEVPCFINDTTGIKLVALKNSNGDVKFFIYDNGKYIKYVELMGNDLIVLPIELDIDFAKYNKTSLVINNQEISAYVYNNSDRFFLLYGKNLETGKEDYYVYDNLEKTFSVFDKDLYQSLIDDNNFYLYALIGSGCLLFLCFIIIFILLASRSKIRKAILKVNGIESINFTAKEDNDVKEKKIIKEDLKPEKRDDVKEDKISNEDKEIKPLNNRERRKRLKENRNKAMLEDIIVDEKKEVEDKKELDVKKEVEEEKEFKKEETEVYDIFGDD